MYEELTKILNYIQKLDGIGDKDLLIKKVRENFGLIQDRKVFYSDYYGIRFSYSGNGGFSNTILSLSNLKKYDDKPFIVCLTTKEKNILYIANSTFLKKISHSSKELRCDNIKGSFNGSDILRNYSGYENKPENFKFLFEIHKEIGFEENLPRLVEATNNISPSGKKFEITENAIIFDAPKRAKEFIESNDFTILKDELDEKVQKYKNEILIAAFIENVNIRGRIIEYLIAGEDDKLKNELILSLHNKSIIPKVETHNGLGDYEKEFDLFYTKTDIKTKIMILNSNPKAYNIDKFLEFMENNKSVFLFYFIGVEPNKIWNQSLVSVFQKDLLNGTIIQDHWAGRSSRGVAQFNGEIIKQLILNENNDIDNELCCNFLSKLINR